MKKKCIPPLLWSGKAHKPALTKVPVIMKSLFYAYLIGSAGLVYASDTYSQTTMVSISMKNQTVKEVLNEIENTTEYSFFYNNSHVDLDRKVSVNVSNADIFEVLDNVFNGTNVSYTVKDKNIVFSVKEQSPVVSQNEKQITGTVIDASGVPIIGANVMVKGTTNGTITDLDGKFTLNVPAGAVLLVSYIGYANQEVKVGNSSSLFITLKEDTELLDEVVVVGYGVVKKSDLTGSVGSVKAKDIQKMPVASVDQALQGRISGVQITTLNGAPGASTTIRIRGGNSINAGNEPLYVIDGIIGGGDLSTINPADIASIEILKDASSTAIYGSRGANGVVLITTKRGEGVEGTRVSYSGYYGLQTPSKLLDMLDGPEAAAFQNEYAEYYDRKIPFEDINAVANTDWQKQMYRKTAPITDHNISVSNSTKNGNYFLSLNYYNQEGIMYNSGFERYQIRFNVDQNLNKYFKVGATLTTSLTNRDNPVVGGLSLLPTAPIYNDDGSYFDTNQISGSIYNNPLAQRNGILDETRTYRGLGNVYGQFTFFDNLIFKTSWGFDISHTKQNKYESVNLPTRIFNKTGGFASVETKFPITYQNENTLNYLLNIGNHSLALMAGFTWQKYQYETLKGSASGFKNDVSSYHAIETGDPITRDIQTGEQEWGLLSYLFRINYSFKNRYMFTVSGRQDGSSRLAKDKRWAFFPSAAFAWRASDEKFIKDLNIFSNLKFRLSYGTSGSQSIEPYSIIDRLDSGANVIGNQEVVTFVPGLSANKNLGWEKTNQIDVGFEAGFLDNRLNIELDYYYKRTNDLLLSKEIPYQTGYVSMLENVGSVENKGFELSLRTINFNNKDFQWNTNLSVSLNRNKILNLGGKDFIENKRGSRLIVGEPLGTFWGVKYLGTWKENEIPEGSKYKPGDPKLDDLNDDGIIDIGDGQIIGNAEPKFYGGIGNDLMYKNWTLSFFFDFSYGNDIYDLAGRDYETGFNMNVYGHNRDRWSESNPDGYYPKAGSAFTNLYATYAGGEFNGGCSLYVHDGSYLRLKNINLQYDIPLKNTNIIKSLQIYTTISNVFTWTNYFGYTPDVSAEGTSSTRRGFDNNAYPQNRTFLFGVKANF